jgi:formamidopyrimidine-DNA glycosylase
MPELPEVEIVARRATDALAGRRITSIMVPGLNALRSLDPAPDVLVGSTVVAVRRRGKLLLVDTDGDHLLLVHLMTGGGMTWKPGTINPRDRAMRVIVRFDDDDPPLRIRERGTRQAMWVRAIRRAELTAGAVPELAKLGPEAWWPEDDPAGGVHAAAIAEALTGNRPLHALLRDQRVLAGVGRTWSDEIVWGAARSPYQRARDLGDEDRVAFVGAIRGTLGAALDAYEAAVGPVSPEKLTKPVQVHGKVGEPCPRCATTLRGVFFESHTIAYCPKEQTGGRALKDRRLSRLGIDTPVEVDED